MRRQHSVTNSDRVNRQGHYIPASELMKADEKLIINTVERGVPVGVPSNIQHDMHRPIGWMSPCGIYIDSTMARSIAILSTPESDDETKLLHGLVRDYWRHYHHLNTINYQKQLIDRIAPALTTDAEFLRIEAVVIRKSGIAIELYPDLFTKNSTFVDKHGLVFFDNLRELMVEVQPGVYHDKDRDLLLFAHSNFRRNQSHLNKLNSYFLKKFTNTAISEDAVSARIRLDPNLIGLPETNQTLIELEYWNGPKFSDDISNIDSGITVHKATDSTRIYENIDKTEFWWKVPELVGTENEFRTCETEELTIKPSAGSDKAVYCCRYIHVEFSEHDKSIRHFDGAIREYATEAYLSRIEKRIDRAGKQSNYSKLFRFDGKLAIHQWKGLMVDFYKGNDLIPEYLGATDQNAIQLEDEKPNDAQAISCDPPLSALLSVTQGESESGIKLVSLDNYQYKDELLCCAEVSEGQTSELYMSYEAPLNTVFIEVADELLNLPPLNIGINENKKERITLEINKITESICCDFANRLFSRVSVPLMWQVGENLVLFSVLGQPEMVSTFLTRLAAAIDFDQLPSEWIQIAAELIKEISGENNSRFSRNVLNGQLLKLPREGELTFKVLNPAILDTEITST